MKKLLIASVLLAGIAAAPSLLGQQVMRSIAAYPGASAATAEAEANGFAARNYAEGEANGFGARNYAEGEANGFGARNYAEGEANGFGARNVAMLRSGPFQIVAWRI